MEFDPCQTWYHGSPRKLSVLQIGSTITQNRELARIFSHKPTVVSLEDDGRIRHNGTVPGYLYVILDELGPQDVIPHPHSTMPPGEEWLTVRELRLRLFSTTEPVPAEQLKDEEIAALLKRLTGQG